MVIQIFMKKLRQIVQLQQDKKQEGDYWDTFLNLILIMIKEIKNLKHQMVLEVFIF